MTARAAGLLAILALLSGCGTSPTDYPLAAGQQNGSPPPLSAEADHPFVVLTFSGGGSRAAALGAAVVKRLNNLHYPAGGGMRALSQDIDVVSSVSGGSVYAADLGLNGPDHAEAFMDRVQHYDGIGWITRRALDPLTWVKLQLENTTRIDLLKDMVEDLLQTKATMAALDQPGKPLLLFNATDMVAGQVFTFDHATLDDLCFDYGRVPVSLAVTASAAFPIAFTPVLLRDDSYLPAGCPGLRNDSLPYQTALQAPSGPYLNLERFRIARYRQSLRNESVRPLGGGDRVPPYRKPEYLRLVDGGVADNSGLAALRHALRDQGEPADLGRLVQAGKLRHLVVIAVNARSDPASDLDTSTQYTTLVTMAEGISGVLVDSASANSAAVFEDFIKLLLDDRDAIMQQHHPEASFAVYPISIDFDQLPTATEAERKEQQRVKSIATSWTLADGDVALLDKVAGELLWRHPCFRLLAQDIGLQGTAEADAAPNTPCPVRPPPPAMPASAHAKPPA